MSFIAKGDGSVKVPLTMGEGAGSPSLTIAIVGPPPAGCAIHIAPPVPVEFVNAIIPALFNWPSTIKEPNELLHGPEPAIVTSENPPVLPTYKFTPAPNSTSPRALSPEKGSRRQNKLIRTGTGLRAGAADRWPLPRAQGIHPLVRYTT